ncbi:MAG: 3'(2'),5'-bisphosphate nucleotidase CysQ [Rhizobiaceae bacterium]
MPEVSAGIAGDLELIRTAAREAATIAMRYFKAEPEVWWKGQSPVSEADYAVDRFLRDLLTKARPDYGWLSEETVDTPERLTARRTFVVDPIDGTRAFLEGRSTWCVSIAVVEAGRPLAGVLDCPAKNRVFEAARGGGATLDGGAITVVAAAASPLVAGPKALVDVLPPELLARIRRAPYVPSLAYRLAMVACGELDGTFVKPNSHDWDLAAADLILAESGGTVVDAAGRLLQYAGPDPSHGPLAAGSGELLERLVAAINPPDPGGAATVVPKPAELL